MDSQSLPTLIQFFVFLIFLQGVHPLAKVKFKDFSRTFKAGSNTGSIRDDPYWTSRENSLELIKLSSINKVSLV
jgi:hypothetical protein